MLAARGVTASIARARAFDFCSKPLTGKDLAAGGTKSGTKTSTSKTGTAKTGKGHKRDVAARAMPAGYENVGMRKYTISSQSGPGLFSIEFGTCVDIVITGTPKNPGGQDRALMHMLIGTSLASAEPKWADFAKAIKDSGMTNMKGMIFTPNTNKDSPEMKDPANAGLDAFAAGLIPDYNKLAELLKLLVDAGDESKIGTKTTVRETHTFARTGELQVDKDKNILMDGRRIIL